MKRKEDLIMKGKNVLQEVKKQKTFKNRMERIMAICELNQLQNEGCLEKLNFYQKNLTKVIKEKIEKLNELENERKKMEDQSIALVEDYNSRLMEHNSLITGLEEELKRKEYLDQNVATTNFLIEKSIGMKKKDIEKELIEHLNEERKVKEMRDNEMRSKRMRDELDELRELYNGVEELFKPEVVMKKIPVEKEEEDGQEAENEPGNEGETEATPEEETEQANEPTQQFIEQSVEYEWHSKPKMIKCIQEIERKRDLARWHLELRDDYERLVRHNTHNEDQLNTLIEANKGKDKNLKNYNYVFDQRAQTIQQIEQKRKEIFDNKSKIKQEIKITNQTNLIIYSINRHLSMQFLGSENEILADSEHLVHVRRILIFRWERNWRS